MSRLESSPYTRNEEYLAEPLFKVHDVLPPAHLGSPLNDEFALELPSQDTAYGELVPDNFFERVNRAWFQHRPERQLWSYDMRRVAQQILPFLWLGPISSALDREFLQREGITLLLAVPFSNHSRPTGRRVADELGIETDSVTLADGQNYIYQYLRAVRRINDHLFLHSTPTHMPKILVFCETGSDRSAAVVVAYIMAMYGLDWLSARWAVSHRRLCVAIGEQIRQSLISFESIVAAKRDVAKAGVNSFGNNARKRGIDATGDDADVDMMDGNTITPFTPRPAPFIDRVL